MVVRYIHHIVEAGAKDRESLLERECEQVRLRQRTNLLVAAVRLRWGMRIAISRARWRLALGIATVRCLLWTARLVRDKKPGSFCCSLQ